MSPPTLSTFSRSEAAEFESEGYQIVEEMPVPLLTPSEAIERHLPRCPDFVSLDAEGLDLAILNCWDLERYRPAVFCIETLNLFADHTKFRKDQRVIQFMEAAGYMLYADTFVNSLFVDASAGSLLTKRNRQRRGQPDDVVFHLELKIGSALCG